MKGILSIEFLIQIAFLNTRSRQSSLLLNNHNAHLTTHEPRKFRVSKVKIFGKIASEQASAV